MTVRQIFRAFGKGSIIPTNKQLVGYLTMTLIVVLLAGCNEASANECSNTKNNTALENNYFQIFKGINSKYDKYLDLTWLKSPMITFCGTPFQDYYFLRAAVKNNQTYGDVYAQLYIHSFNDEWLFLRTAFSEGFEMQTVKIDSKVTSSCTSNNCMLREDIAINITKKQLEHFAESGFDVKVVGKRGDIILNIPATYFKAFMDNLNTWIN